MFSHSGQLEPVRKTVILGGGSAGLIAAMTLKRRLPTLEVEVIRSPDIGIIGVGEGTTAAFPRHFFEYLKCNPGEFYAGAEPTWKLGIQFLWGPRPAGFYYTFHNELKSRWPELGRNTGFYYNRESGWAGLVSACMAHDMAFSRSAEGAPAIHRSHAFHIENVKLVGFLERACLQLGVKITDATVAEAEPGPSGIRSLVLQDGSKVQGDLFVDASGFRSELLGRFLGEEFLSYSDTLFNDRAVIAGWPRTTEVIKPYTIAETMNAGWCWQIDHEHWINRGYVYSSAFLSDDEALEEFRRKCPLVANEPRIVKFRAGRYRRHWIGNVVAIGNSAGFVEPLEATALQVICVESSTLADCLSDSLQQPTPSLIDLYNQYNCRGWDDIRDFLAVHFRFNNRIDSPYWQACRHETNLHGAAPIVRFYQENGPSLIGDPVLLNPDNSFGLEGYLALLLGQEVPHGKPYIPPAAEQKIWRAGLEKFGEQARSGFSVKESLEWIRDRHRAQRVQGQRTRSAPPQTKASLKVF